MRTAPNYLVQTPDKSLHAYWREDVLLIDLHQNKGEEINMFILKPGFGTTHYVPCTEAEIRARMNKQESA